MKRRIISLLMITVLALTMVALTACRREAADPAATESETIIIGGAMSVTGIQAPLDAPAVEGIAVAIAEINAAGGINGKMVEFRNMDSKSDPATAAEVAKQLIDQGAVAIITASDYDFGGPAARAAQEAGIVGISPSASSPLFGSTMLGDKQFTLSMWNTTMGAVIAERAFADGLTSVYVVTDDFIDYTKSLSRYFVESFETLGGTVLREDIFSQGKVDTAALIARYKALPEVPDFIYISSYMPDLGTIIKEFRSAGIDLPIYGGDAYDDPALFDLLGEVFGNDIIWDSHSFSSEEAVPGFTEYNAAYKAIYNADVDAPWSMAGYDVVKVLTDAMRETGGTDGAQMAKYMEDTTFSLLTGSLDWSDAAGGHEPNKAAAVIELVNGEPFFIEWSVPDNLPRP
jgi:branched-chain amino acid transport system substrate-binding protein